MSSTIDQGSEPSASADVVEPATGRPGGGTINIRNISVKCGNCDTYQTLASFSPARRVERLHLRVRERRLRPAVTRTLVEVPRELDEFARRDPEWRRRQDAGASRSWAGADPRS